MIIQNTPIQSNFNTTRTKSVNKQFSIDTISFSGHVGAEKYSKYGIKWLKHQTALFREVKIDELIKDYIFENFLGKKKINIISAGCSTGEEAFSMSMLLKSIKDKVSILGLDLSAESIKQANQGLLLMQKHKPAPEGYIDISGYMGEIFPDAYLAFSKNAPLNLKENLYKKLFDEYFEFVDMPVPEPKISLSEKINRWYNKKVLKVWPMELESKYYQLKSGKADNCKFVQANVSDIDKITKDEKADVILFRNTLYHLVTDDVGPFRNIKKNAEKIIEELMYKFRESLNPKGLIVFGEDEASQVMDNDIVPRVMKRLGFNLLEKENHSGNIWQKI